MVVSKDSGNTRTSASYKRENEEMRSLLESAVADNAELRRILSFYADPANYEKTLLTKSKVTQDGGAIARMMIGWAIDD